MFEKYFKDYLKEFMQTSKSAWSYEAGMVLLGAKEMYDATGEVEYCEWITEYMDQYVLEDGSLNNLNESKENQYKMGFGKILCFLCEQTKKEKYKIALDTLVNEVRQLEEKYVGLPLYLEYETKFNEKENYNDIYRCMKCARAYFEDEAVSFKCLVNDLMTLIDMHENASEEVFDQYKQYAIWFKGTLKKILACQYKETEESARIAYCILKGCRLGALIQEKYQHIGEGIVQELLAKDGKEFKDLYQIGASAMAYAEFLKRSEVL